MDRSRCHQTTHKSKVLRGGMCGEGVRRDCSPATTYVRLHTHWPEQEVASHKAGYLTQCRMHSLQLGNTDNISQDPQPTTILSSFQMEGFRKVQWVITSSDLYISASTRTAKIWTTYEYTTCDQDNHIILLALYIYGSDLVASCCMADQAKDSIKDRFASEARSA